jgi:hypothetical protein
MKKQIMTIVLGAVFALGATAAFAQSNGTAIGGGAAGGPNSIYRDSPQGTIAYFGTAANQGQKVVHHIRKQK